MIALEFNRTLRSLPSYLDVKLPIFSPKHYLIYKKTKNLRVIQLLLGHKKLESTVRYLGIEVDDALGIS
ncbi:integrase [Escherichia coli]|nr:integrase [Escherichia coli]CTR12920.1 site-specific recombinase%2C phage integrase family [Escherichia coli]